MNAQQELEKVKSDRDIGKAEMMEKSSQQFKALNLDVIQREIREMKKKAGSGAHSNIAWKEHHDHKNVSLWTREGKRVGPMHPDNLESTWQRFYDVGIILLAKQPTPQQIEEYKQTDEYKEKEKKFLANRELKNKSKKPEQIDRLIKQMAEMTGQTVQALTKILSPDQVMGNKTKEKGNLRVQVSD